MQSGDDEGMLGEEVRHGHSIRCVLMIPAKCEHQISRDCQGAAIDIEPRWLEGVWCRGGPTLARFDGCTLAVGEVNVGKIRRVMR